MKNIVCFLFVQFGLKCYMYRNKNLFDNLILKHYTLYKCHITLGVSHYTWDQGCQMWHHILMLTLGYVMLSNPVRYRNKLCSKCCWSDIFLNKYWKGNNQYFYFGLCVLNINFKLRNHDYISECIILLIDACPPNLNWHYIPTFAVEKWSEIVTNMLLQSTLNKLKT